MKSVKLLLALSITVKSRPEAQFFFSLFFFLLCFPLFFQLEMVVGQILDLEICTSSFFFFFLKPKTFTFYAFMLKPLLSEPGPYSIYILKRKSIATVLRQSSQNLFKV